MFNMRISKSVIKLYQASVHTEMLSNLTRRMSKSRLNNDISVTLCMGEENQSLNYLANTVLQLTETQIPDLNPRSRCMLSLS